MMPDNYSNTTICSNPLRQVMYQLVIIGLLFVGIYYRTFPHLYEAWQKPDFSHGIIIPLVSLYLIWLYRDQFKKLSVVPNFIIGVPLILIASFVLILSNRGGVIIIEELSMIIMLFGLIMLLLGTGYSKVLAFPIGYLFFMVPVLDPIINHDVFWRFQLATAEIAAYLLYYFKVPVFHDQQYLQLPNMTLEVAQACSGIKFLLSLIALAIPLAQLTLRTHIMKIILFLLAIAIAILTNGLRVALIGVWVYHFKSTVAIHGPGHMLQGWFVSTLGIILLFICAVLLQKFQSFNPGIAGKKNHRMPNIDSHTIDMKRFNTAFIFLILLGAYTGYAIYLSPPKIVPLKRDLQHLPLNIGGWKGEDSIRLYEVIHPSGADSELFRKYKDPVTGKSIGLYIGYFASQTQGKELITVTLNDFYLKTFQYILKTSIPGVFHSINKALIARGDKINNVLITNGDKDLHILYWYDINGYILSNRYKAKLATAINGTIHNTTNGAIIMITNEIDKNFDVNELTKTDESFIKVLLPLLNEHMPN